MRWRILVSDPIGRWTLGEVGVSVENDFAEKYDLKLLLPGTIDCVLFGERIKAVRVYYFYRHEVSEVPT